VNLGAKRIREYLEKREMTQEGMATALGTTPANLSRIINGIQKPAIDLAVRIKDATNGYVMPEDFVKEDTPPSKMTIAREENGFSV